MWSAGSRLGDSSGVPFQHLPGSLRPALRYYCSFACVCCCLRSQDTNYSYSHAQLLGSSDSNFPLEAWQPLEMTISQTVWGFVCVKQHTG